MWFPCSYTFSEDRMFSSIHIFLVSWTYLLRFLNRVDCREVCINLDDVWEAGGAQCNSRVSQAHCREITRSRNAVWLSLLAQCVSIWDLHVPSSRIPCASLEGLISHASEPLNSVASWPLSRCVLLKFRMYHCVSADRFIFCSWWISALQKHYM